MKLWQWCVALTLPTAIGVSGWIYVNDQNLAQDRRTARIEQREKDAEENTEWLLSELEKDRHLLVAAPMSRSLIALDSYANGTIGEDDLRHELQMSFELLKMNSDSVKQYDDDRQKMIRQADRSGLIQILAVDHQLFADE